MKTEAFGKLKTLLLHSPKNLKQPKRREVLTMALGCAILDNVNLVVSTEASEALRNSHAKQVAIFYWSAL